MLDQLSQSRRASYPPPPVVEVRDASTGPGFGHVPVRIYRTSTDAAAPVIVFFHGGGHVIGSLDTHDTAARFLALAAGCTVVSVDYRMGPEHPFPAAVEDCYDATRWVAAQAEALEVDPAKLVVCGDSAGGNLAAVVALLARDNAAFSVAAQALIYPVTDLAGGTASYEKYGVGYGVLEAVTVNWFKERYLRDAADLADFRASPARAKSLAGLPPALVLTAQCDVLRDEGAAYAQQMQSAGGTVEYVEFAGMIHGFFGYLGIVDDAERAHRTVAGFVQGVWQSQEG
jgi:acetyl esterase